MQLPKYKKKLKTKLKMCQEPGCGMEYYGHPISKYCKNHQDIRNRKRKRRIPKGIHIDNIIFKHHFHESTTVEFTCALEGCDRRYSIRVLSKLFIYPKYCELHRNPYKRKNFERINRVKNFA